MRLMICGDIHIGKYKLGGIDSEMGINSHLRRIVNSFDFLINKAIDLKCDKFVILGDLFKTRMPDDIERKMLAQKLKKIVDNGIEVWIVLGNHDLFRDTKISVVSVIEVLKVPGIVIFDTFTEWVVEGTRFVFVPWRWGTDYEYIKKSNLFTILFGHLSVEGAVLGSEKAYVSIEDGSVKWQYFENVDFAFLGHIHKYQKVLDNVVYVGNVERIDFSEKDDKKFGVVCEIQNGEMSWDLVEIDAIKMVEVNTTFDTYKEDLEKLENLEDTVLKITIKVDKVNRKQIDFKWIDDILRQKKLYFLHSVRYLVDDVNFEQINSLHTTTSSRTIQDLLKDYIRMRYNFEKDFENKVFSMMNDVIQRALEV